MTVPTCRGGVCVSVQDNNILKATYPALSQISPKVGVMVSPGGVISKFVSNQVIFKPKSRHDLQKFLRETKGKILHDGRLAPPPQPISRKKMRNIRREVPYYLIQVDLSRFPNLSTFSQKIGSHRGFPKGDYRFNEDGLRLTNLLLERIQKGDILEPNLLFELMIEPDVLSYLEEELIDDTYSDPFTSLSVVTEGVRLQKAWQYIDLLNPPAAQAISSGRSFEDAVWVAFIDEGFKGTTDLLSTYLQLDGVDSTYVPESNSWGGWDTPDYEFDYNVMDEPVNPSGQPATSIFCQNTATCWHGLAVQSVASSLLNNRAGIAGTGGQVIFPMLFKNRAAGGGTLRVSLYQSAAMVDTAVHWGADIISMSFGYWGFDYAGMLPCRDIPQCSYFREAVRDAIEDEDGSGEDDRPVIVVAAAGNQGWNLNEVNNIYPCEFDGVICVGSGNESRWVVPGVGGSNYGTIVALYASGPFSYLTSRDCLASAPCSMTLAELANSPVSGSTTASDTSLASPYVAGIIAMMKSLKPTLTPLEALDILQITASPGTDETMRAADADPASSDVLSPRYVNPYRAIQEVMRREGTMIPSDGNNSQEEAAEIDTNDGIESGTDGPTIFRPFVVSGSIIPGEDEDWYRFNSSVSSYRSLVISLAARNVGGEVDGERIAINGPLFLQLGTTTADHLTPITINPLPPAGRYSLKIYGDDDSFGNYQLTLQENDVALPPDRYDDQIPSGEVRNDTQGTATWLRRIALGEGESSSEMGEVQASELTSPLGADLAGFNLDRASDQDYFQLQLPHERCLSPEEISELESSDRMSGMVRYEYRPGYFAISLMGTPLTHHYPDSIQLELFDGTTWSPIPAASLTGSVSTARGLRIECPHSIIPSGVIGIRIRSRDDQTERRNYYNLNLKYVPWSFQIRVSRDWLPPLEHLIPEASLVGFLTADDLKRIDLTKPHAGYFPRTGVCRSTACPDDPDPEYYLFELGEAVTNFSVNLSSSPTCQMNVRLLDGERRLIKSGENFKPSGSEESTSRLSKTTLNHGRYLLEIDGKTPCGYSLSMGQEK